MAQDGLFLLRWDAGPSDWSAAPSAAFPGAGDSGVDASLDRLKGVRDIVSGLAILAFMASGISRGVVSSCLLKPSSPSATCCSFLQREAPTKSAFGMHGLTAVLMVLSAIPMMIRAP